MRRRGRIAGALLQPAKLMIKNLMKMGLHLVISRVHVGAQFARVLSDLLIATEILGDMPSDAVVLVGQLGIHDLRLKRQWRSHLLSRGHQPGRLRRWGRRRRLLGRTLLPALGLSLGLGPHLGDTLQEFFDFVTHGGSGFEHKRWNIGVVE